MFDQEEFPIITASSLKEIGKSHSLRCDAKQTEIRFLNLEHVLSSLDCFFLGQFLPETLYKGTQHSYLDTPTGVPVINTLSIQNLQINQDDCRHIAEENFESLNENRKLTKNDVLVTMDGGTSIGKPVLFDLDGDWTVDSHVAILRPKEISPKSLTYLLASPLGQLQFQRAESGASGQTAVTEEDLRRFVFPRTALKNLNVNTTKLDEQRKIIRAKIEKLNAQEMTAWEDFSNSILQ